MYLHKDDFHNCSIKFLFFSLFSLVCQIMKWTVLALFRFKNFIFFIVQIPFPEYTPVDYTAPVVLSNPPWADPDLLSL